MGLSLGAAAPAISPALVNVSVIGSGGIGMDVHPNRWFQPGSSVTVTGGASYPVRVGPAAFSTFAYDSLSQAKLLGNARDEVLFYDAFQNTGSIVAYGHLPWHLEGRLTMDSLATLYARPGARFVYDPNGILEATRGGMLEIHGSASAPAVFTAANPAAGPLVHLFFPGGTIVRPDTSRIVNAVVEHTSSSFGAVQAQGGRVVLDSVRIRQSSGRGIACYNGSTCIVSRTVVDTSRGIGVGAVDVNNSTFIANGLTVRDSRGEGVLLRNTTTAPIQLTNCTVTGSTLDGIQVNATIRGVVINNCNLSGNTEEGVENGGSIQVDARFNWWGDPGGPFGPNGDGASGDIDHSQWLTAPVGTSAAIRVISTSAATVARPVPPGPGAVSGGAERPHGATPPRAATDMAAAP
jgi:hypothetical protein